MVSYQMVSFIRVGFSFTINKFAYLVEICPLSMKYNPQAFRTYNAEIFVVTY